MTEDESITLLSFGYWGWGNSTKRLIEAFDALEQSRGFKPPLLVDIRISRSVRAPGFNGSTLEKLIGAERYVHMPELGNRAVLENTLKRITIRNPEAARSLLDRAISEQRRTRRIVFFCACPYQMENGETCCHRYEVGSLLLKHARHRNQQIVLAEWPGTEPQMLSVEIRADQFKKLRRGAKSIPLPRETSLDNIASITWGSVAHGWAGGESLNARVNRAMWRKDGWYLPVLDVLDAKGPVASSRDRKAWGFLERSA